jgi:hypothetical protein
MAGGGWLEDYQVSHYYKIKNEQLQDIIKAQRKALVPELAVFQQNYPVRDEAMARAYLSGAYTMNEIEKLEGSNAIPYTTLCTDYFPLYVFHCSPALAKTA